MRPHSVGYLNNPNFCPECGSKNIYALQSTFEGTQAWQAVTCDECDAEWHDLYTLTGCELVVYPRIKEAGNG